MTALFVILSPIFSQCLESKVNSMRTSQYLFSTLKETPAEAAIVSHQLMLRAGMIRPLASGLYNWMPTGWRVLRKVEKITSSSPLFANTWNSCEALPPIEPVSACTARKSKPKRLKILL